MTVTPAQLDKARAARAKEINRRKALEDELRVNKRSFSMIIGCLLHRALPVGESAVTFDVDELERFDPARLNIIVMDAYQKVIVGILKDGKTRLELDVSKPALEAVSDPAHCEICAQHDADEAAREETPCLPDEVS